MFKFTKSNLPDNFKDIFSPVSSRYTLRSQAKNKLNVPKNTCKYVEHSLSYRGPKIWNSISDNLKNLATGKLFKKNLKAILVLSGV